MMARKGLHSALLTAFDAIIVDLMLPVLDGLTLIERLRHARVNTPVLILSAKRSVDERVRGLQAGGDDYLVKPFAFAELVARLRALIRRAGSQPEATRLVSRRPCRSTWCAARSSAMDGKSIFSLANYHCSSTCFAMPTACSPRR